MNGSEERDTGVPKKKKKDQVFLWGIGFTKYNSGKISSLTLKYSLSNLIFVEVKKKK